MLRFIFIFVLTAGAIFAAEKPRALPAPTFVTVPNPADSSALVPNLTRAPDGTVWLTYIEPALGYALRCVPFDATTNQWGEPRTIVTGTKLFPFEYDPPVLTAGPAGHLTAVWPVVASATPSTSKFHVLHVSSSTDAGRTWTPPVPLTLESDATSRASLATLADGRVLAA